MADESEPGRDAARIAAVYLGSAERLRRILVGIVGDRALAEDALQAAFTKAVERPPADLGDLLDAWFCRVAINEALSLRRRREVDTRAMRRLADGAARGEPPAEAMLMRRESVERVRAALSQLSSDQRQVVQMRVHEQKTFRQIADELGQPLGTVLSRMQAALRNLRLALDDG